VEGIFKGFELGFFSWVFFALFKFKFTTLSRFLRMFHHIMFVSSIFFADVRQSVCLSPDSIHRLMCWFRRVLLFSSKAVPVHFSFY